ncbi:MAG TPA: hypothetical protein VFV99_15070 [Kofleriaceae bacterium]|nr:hypothetical protein [Kofleriaceae bacterium]
MRRLLCCVVVVVLAGLVEARGAWAADQETPVELQMSSIDQRQLTKRLDDGDTLTGKAQIKLRYYRETTWLLEDEVDVGTGAKVEIAKLDRKVKLDRSKQVECHVWLPTTKGKFLGVVGVSKPSQVLGSKPSAFKLGCRLMGAALAKQDAVDAKWPDIGTQTDVNFWYSVNIDAAIGNAVAKAKDDVSRANGKLAVLVELFDPATKEKLGVRSFELTPRKPKGLEAFAETTNADSGPTEIKLPEGQPVLFRLRMDTQKGGVVFAEGEVTAWRLGSNQPRSTASIEAKAFKFEKDPKKAPKPGEWGATKTPAKAVPAKAPAKAPAKK